MTPLHFIAEHGNIDICDALLKHAKKLQEAGDNSIAIYNVKDGRGLTPVFRSTSAHIAVQFLKAGFENLELRGPQGETLLYHCTKQGALSADLVHALTHQVNERVSFKHYKTQEMVVRPPVFAAPHERTVKAFLKSCKQHGIELDTVADDGYTLLHHCVEENIASRYILRELGELRGRVHRGKTPLQCARSDEVVEEILHNLDLELSEKLDLYRHCLENKLFSMKIGNLLCPLLPDINQGK